VAPGIFTIDQAGTGLAAALHQDGVTPVTINNPAHSNEVVSLYVTGLGVLIPSLATGQPAGGNNIAQLIPTATIDGANTEVTFFGGAPGFVGLNQVNVKIPATARTAPDLAVRITSTRQSNLVTIPVGP
jgi:uncharacterized protein (TIGR03437 family)